MLTIQAALTNSGLPAILVATKCEHPEDDWEVDAEAMANHKYFQACIATYKVSTEAPKEARACLQAILRAAVSYRRGITDGFSCTPKWLTFYRRERRDGLAATCPIESRITRPVKPPAPERSEQTQPSELRPLSPQGVCQPFLRELPKSIFQEPAPRSAAQFELFLDPKRS